MPAFGGRGIGDRGSDEDSRVALPSPDPGFREGASPIPDPQSPIPRRRRILGIDPGLASTGWGVLDCEGGRLRHVCHGHISTKPGEAPELRLLRIARGLRAVLDEHAPDEAAVEALFFGKNVSSAIPVAQARGAVFLVLAERGVPVAEFRPNAVKQGVAGVGSASKRQVQEMARVILGLGEVPSPDHAADALGVAICAASFRGTLA